MSRVGKSVRAFSRVNAPGAWQGVKAGRRSLFFDHTSLATGRMSIGGRNMLTQCLRQLLMAAIACQMSVDTVIGEARAQFSRLRYGLARGTLAWHTASGPAP